MMSPVDRVLSKLDHVKSAGQSKWKARCPAHDDYDPSLSVRQIPDGTVLLHCFAGCSTAEVLEAVKLQIRDLFPPLSGRKVRPGPSRACIDHERNILCFGQDLLAQGKTLLPDDLERMELANQRLAGLGGSGHDENH